MNLLRTTRCGFLAARLALAALSVPGTVAADEVAWPGVKGAAGRHLGAWLTGSGGGIDGPSAVDGVLSVLVRAYDSQTQSQAEVTMRSRILAMNEAAHARMASRAPTREFHVETLWLCGGCIDIELQGWDWADLNAAFWIEPWEFLGADPTGVVSQAFLECHELTIEQLDDEGVVAGRRRTDDGAMIRDVYIALMLGLHDAEARWAPMDWERVSPADFASYVGVRPSLRIRMVGEVSLLAEIDTRTGLAVLHADGKRGVYGIDIGALHSGLVDRGRSLAHD